MSAHQDHTALLVDHGLIGIDLVGFELLSRRSEFDQVTAGPVANGDVDLAIMENRRGNHHVAVSGLFQVPPQKPAIVGRYARHAFIGQLHILPDSANLNRNRG